jgi:hypothetical protein
VTQKNPIFTSLSAYANLLLMNGLTFLNFGERYYYDRENSMKLTISLRLPPFPELHF